MKEDEGIHQRMYVHDPQTDNSVLMARGKGGEAGNCMEVGKGEGNGDICNSVNTKNKVKK